MRNEKVFTIQELRRVAIACPHCGTEVVLDMGAFTPAVPPRSDDRKAFAPRRCPACELPYDSALGALDDLQRSYRTLAKIEGVVTFRADEKPES